MLIYIVLLVGMLSQGVDSDDGSGRFTKGGASRYCKRRNRNLYDYSEVTESLATDILALRDGESAWIEGSAELSSYVLWIGCIKKINSAPVIYELEKKSLYKCLEICSPHVNKNKRVIGVSNTTCFCLSDSLILDWTPNACDIRCTSYNFDLCGGINAMSVYRFEEIFEDEFANKEQYPRQCVYQEFIGYKVPKLFTSSCYKTSKSASVSGSFCLAFGHMVNSTTCTSVKRMTFCFITHDNQTWKTANEYCLQSKGYQLPYLPLDNTLFRKPTSYWVGLYRSFLPTDTGNRDACLAAIRVGRDVYIEPDSCLAMKSVLCRRTNLLPTLYTDRTTSEHLKPKNHIASQAATISTNDMTTKPTFEMESKSRKSTPINYVSRPQATSGSLYTAMHISSGQITRLTDYIIPNTSRVDKVTTIKTLKSQTSTSVNPSNTGILTVSTSSAAQTSEDSRNNLLIGFFVGATVLLVFVILLYLTYRLCSKQLNKCTSQNFQLGLVPQNNEVQHNNPLATPENMQSDMRLGQDYASISSVSRQDNYLTCYHFDSHMMNLQNDYGAYIHPIASSSPSDNLYDGSETTPVDYIHAHFSCSQNGTTAELRSSLDEYT